MTDNPQTPDLTITPQTCVSFSGRPEGAKELRDAIHLMRPGDLAGPAGEAYLNWQRAVERLVSIKGLYQALPSVNPSQIGAWATACFGQLLISST